MKFDSEYLGLSFLFWIVSLFILIILSVENTDLRNYYLDEPHRMTLILFTINGIFSVMFTLIMSYLDKEPKEKSASELKGLQNNDKVKIE